MIIEELFKKHLFIEYSKSIFTKDGRLLFHENIEKLFEERGIIPNLNIFSQTFIEYVLGKINLDKEEDKLFINKNIFSNIQNCFFENVQISIEYKKSSINDGDGRYKHGNILNELDDDKLKFLIIDISISSDKYHFRELLEKIFAHEITHAFDNFQRLKNKQMSLFDTNKKDGYENNKEWFSSNYNDRLMPIEAFRRVIYFLNKSEMNAYASTLKSEMKKNIESYNNVDNVSKLLKNCSIYEHYNAIKEYLAYFINLRDTKIKQEILNEYNRIFEKDIKNYSKLKQILRLRFERRVEKMLNKFSKISFDTYHEYKTGTTVCPTGIKPIKKIIE